MEHHRWHQLGGTLTSPPAIGMFIPQQLFRVGVEQFHLDALNHLAQFLFRINPFLLACYQEIWDRDIWLDGLGGIYHYSADYSQQVLEQYPNPGDFEEGSEERYEARQSERSGTPNPRNRKRRQSHSGWPSNR